MRWAETVVVGAGQAGLAISHELTRAGRDHVVLERGRVGERWRSERWDSLALLTPNRLNRLPGTAPAEDPHGFTAGATFVEQLEHYARSFDAPVIAGVAVERVVREGDEYRVTTSAGTWSSTNVVVATGAMDVPQVPAVSGDVPDGIAQLHSARYRNPRRLAPGGVLVVGAGTSGQQIALELVQAGRDVVLAVGRHGRMPRRYRGRDSTAWLEAIGHTSVTIDEMPDPAAARRAPSLPLDGRDGGLTIDLEVLSRAGVRVTGRLVGFSEGAACFADDLHVNAARAELKLRRLLNQIDAHIAQYHDPAPGDRVAPIVLPQAPTSVDLAGIGTILWATGYGRSYAWLDVPVLDADGDIVHRRGVTPSPGLYTVGMRFQHRRDSHFIGGVGRDAAYIAKHIAAGLPDGFATLAA